MESIAIGHLPEGRQLRVRRVALGLSQSDVADALGCWTAAVSAIENGRGNRYPKLAERVRQYLAERESAH